LHEDADEVGSACRNHEQLVLKMLAATFNPESIGTFLRADGASLHDWILRRQGTFVCCCVAAIVAGAGLYGAAMGSWRDPLQALYAGIKLPLVILLTTLGNGLLNGMLAPLLGLNTTFRQSLSVVLVSFAMASVILGALSPVAMFVVWNTPPLTAATTLWSPEYGFMQLTLAGFIALAGTVANVRLLPVLRQWTPSAAVTRKVLFAWLAGNLFLGSQICWVLRPFIWDPASQTQFIGEQYFRGSFYETVFEAARRLIFS
jgi:hypothetical protein